MFTVISNLYEPPVSPTTVKIKYSSVDVEGRLTTQFFTATELPEECSVVQLEGQVYDLLGVSPRNPIELRYWGKPLQRDKLLKDYGIKDNPIKDHAGLAEVTVVVKPKLPAGAPIPAADQPFKKIRIASNKLQQPVAIEDGLSYGMKVADLKALIEERFKNQKVYLAVDKTEADERTGTIDLLRGDQLMLEQANVGGKKGIMRVKRVRDGVSGNAMEADMMEVSLPIEEQALLFEGLRMDDNMTLQHYELIHNERLFLDFRWPWEAAADAEGGGAAPAKKDGGKKKK